MLLTWLGGLAILLGCAGLGLLVGVVFSRVGQNHDPLDDTGFVADGLSATLGTVGGLLAFVLGFLVVFTLDGYTAAQDVASSEASAYSAAFEAAVLLPPEQAAPVKRNIACLIESVRTEGWYFDEGDGPSMDDNVEAWWSATRDSLSLLTEPTPLQEYAAETVFAELAEARAQGEQRVLMNGSSIPPVIWVVIFVAFAATVALSYISLRNNSFILLASIGLMTVVVGAVVWTLITFANPFSTGDGTAVQADDLTGTVERLRDTYSGPAWQPCPARPP
ncbi:MAG: hypothetical protein ACKO70_09105 [Actinomycetota bacterium]